MAAASDDTCPRCGGAFHCGIDDAQPCVCSTVALSADTLARLRDRHGSCLCLRCLQTLSLNREEPDGDAR